MQRVEERQEISADAEEDALLFHNWLLENQQPAVNQHLTVRRIEDSGKACDNPAFRAAAKQ